MTQPSVSVVIAQWGETELTGRAIEALRRSDYEGQVEVLVYDNASPEGPGRAATMEGVRLVAGDTNVGFGPAIDRLAEVSVGDVILILNNDTVVDPRCLRLLVERWQAADRPFAVSPQYRDFTGEVLEMGGFLGSDASGAQLFRNMRPPVAMERLSYPAHYGSAAALLVDGDLFRSVGGFDDVFAPAYYEDADICRKMADAGRPTVVEPRAVAYHYEGGTAGTDVTKGYKTYQVRNRMTFADRHADWLSGLAPISQRAALNEALPPPSRFRVLWAAPSLPRPDQAAGDVRVLSMIEALRQAGDIVAVWPEHAHDAERYGSLLERRGIPWFGLPPRHRGLGSPERAYSHLDEILTAVPWDVLVVSFAELASRVIPTARRYRPGMPVIVDAVDLQYIRRERAGDADSGKLEEMATFAASDGVIAASDLEAGIIAGELPGKPTVGYTMAAVEPRPLPPPTERRLVFLGSFHHHPNVDAVDWWAQELAPMLHAVLGRPVPLHVVGANTEAHRDEWPAEYVQVVGWVEDLVDVFVDCGVFVAPLRYGAGTKGKVTAALSHGRPIITTPVGAEGFDDDVASALLVTDDATTMVEMLASLITDDAAWEERASATRKAAEEAWGAERASELLLTQWLDRRVRYRPVVV